MSRSPLSALRALAFGATMGLVFLLGAALPVAAQDEVCATLTLDELQTALGVPFEEGFGFEGYCSWEAETTGGRISVALILEAGSLEELRGQEPGGMEVSVGGVEGYAVQQELPAEEGLPATRAAAVAVASDAIADAIYVESTDPGVDVMAAALALMELAAPRLATLELPVGPVTEFDQPPACDIFEPGELAEILGQPLTETEYSQGSCAWESDADATVFASISLSYDIADLAELRAYFPGGQDMTVSDLPAYLYSFEMEDSSQAALALDLGPETATLSIISPDPAFDAPSVAVSLLELALERGLTSGPEPEPGPSACSYLSAEAMSQAVGTGMDLELEDIGGTCSYLGGSEEDSLDILVTPEDPEYVDFAAESVGAQEVEGVGDQAWWSADYGVLYAVEGDRAFSVFVAGSGDMDAEMREALARSIMQALLASG